MISGCGCKKLQIVIFYDFLVQVKVADIRLFIVGTAPARNSVLCRVFAGASAWTEFSTAFCHFLHRFGILFHDDFPLLRFPLYPLSGRRADDLSMIKTCICSEMYYQKK